MLQVGATGIEEEDQQQQQQQQQQETFFPKKTILFYLHYIFNIIYLYYENQLLYEDMFCFPPTEKQMNTNSSTASTYSCTATYIYSLL
jgi:hypothetical protein